MEIEAADVNGDGYTDLVTVNAQSNSISVLLGNGDGTFQDQFGFFGGLEVVDLLLIDFDGDGDLDLASLANQNKRVHLFENPGDGRFTDRQSFPLFEKQASDEPLYSFGVADVFDDGRLDIVVPMNDHTHYTTVIENIGQFDFAPQYVYFNGADETTHILEVDLNLDGHLDLVRCSEARRIFISLYLKDGKHDYSSPLESSFGGGEIHVADLNGDGYPDLFAAPNSLYGHEASRLDVFINDGAGRFPDHYELQANRPIADAAIGDVDLDGDLDIVATRGYSFDGSGFTVFHNNGDGTFADEIESPIDGVTVGVTLSDVNSDGIIDVLTSHPGLDRVGVTLNTGDGTYGSRGLEFEEYDPQDYIRVDMNGDAVQDLVFARGGLDQITVALVSQDGLSHDATTYPVDGYSVQVVAEDFDLDGDPDIVSANSDTDTLSLLMNNGDGTLSDEVVYAGVDADLNADQDQLHVHFLNDDAYPDLVVVNKQSRNVTVLLNDGGAGFVEIPVPQFEDSRYTQVGDHDGDGDIDLVCPSLVDGYVELLRNDGSGAFSHELQAVAGIEFGDCRARDIDGDGDLDLVVNNPIMSQFRVFTNAGSGEYTLFQVIDSGILSHAGVDKIEVVDLDADQDLDVALYREIDGFMYLFLNDGDGMFVFKSQHIIGFDDMYWFEFEDFNADGYPDLSFWNFYVDGISVVYNLCGSGPACPADLNADGDLNFFDVSAFLKAYGASDPVADFNGDGQFNFFDVTAFILAFNAGCP